MLMGPEMRWRMVWGRWRPGSGGGWVVAFSSSSITRWVGVGIGAGVFYDSDIFFMDGPFLYPIGIYRRSARRGASPSKKIIIPFLVEKKDVVR